MDNKETGLSITWVYSDKRITFPIVLEENTDDEKEVKVIDFND